MDAGKIISYVLLSLLVLLIIVVVVLALIQIEDEHEFIKDLQKIKLDEHNELLQAGCDAYNKCNCSGNICSKKENCDMPLGLQAIVRLIKADEKLSPKFKLPYKQLLQNKDYCGESPSKENNITKKIKTTFSFSKLEAKQIYNNNNLIIDNVYDNKDSKRCFQSFIKVVGPDLGHVYDSQAEFEKDIWDDLSDFGKKYTSLDTRRQKYINIIIEDMLNVVGLQIL